MVGVFFGKHHAKPQKIEWLHRIQATFGNVPQKPNTKVDIYMFLFLGP